MSTFDTSIGMEPHDCIEQYEPRWGAPNYDDWGNKIQDPDLECQICDLFGTEDCTKDNCSLVGDGFEPHRYNEDQDDVREAVR